MANIAPRPAGKNFYGVFHTPPGGDFNAMYGDEFNWATQWKPQIDAMKSIGANLMVYFGSANFSGTLANYVAQRRQIVEYLAEKGMYALSYATATFYQAGATNAQIITIMEADAAMMCQYPNVIGYATTDEPWASSVDYSPGVESNATIASWVAAQYAALRAVVPANFPICCAPNPSIQSGSDSFSYVGASITRCDSVAPYCDFFCVHPFHYIDAGSSSAMRAGFPGKQILMPSSVLSVEGASDIATKSASIMGQVGSNGFRGMAWFLNNDFDSNTWGIFNSDMTERTTKTNAFRANLPAGLSARNHRITRGKPRLSQLTTWGYA